MGVCEDCGTIYLVGALLFGCLLARSGLQGRGRGWHWKCMHMRGRKIIVISTEDRLYG